MRPPARWGAWRSAGWELAGGDAVERHRDVALPVHLRPAQRQPVVDGGAERELVGQPAEHPEHVHRAALAAGVDRLPHGGRPVPLELQLLAPIQPVGPASDTNTAARSSSIASGTTKVPKSAKGTRTYSAWLPASPPIAWE